MGTRIRNPGALPIAWSMTGRSISVPGLLVALCATTWAQAPEPAETATAPKDEAVASPRAAAGASPTMAALVELASAGQLGRDYLALDGDGTTVLTRYHPPRRGTPRGALLVVPGRGELITSSSQIDALVDEFTPNAFGVAAAQPPGMPLTGAETDDEALVVWRATLDPVLDHLAAQGVEAVVVVGFDDAAAALARCLADGYAQGRVHALVTRGSWQADVSELATPIFEQIPEHDARAVRHARERLDQGFERGRTGRVATYPGADRRFSGWEPQLARDLRGWIDRAVTTL